MCPIKLNLTGKTPKLAGKCLMTGCYHKDCNLYRIRIIETLLNFSNLF